MLKAFSLCADASSSGSEVEDFFAIVKGGNSESITALVSKKLPDPKLMKLWGEAVHFNPDFIRMKVSFSFFLLFSFMNHVMVPLVP